ncbi:PepSY-associated TM helix domain-containing protein [Vogesella oryzae]|uniref:PepSY-associated TM helix domain-containing protein n=1 Tax=Vogesella oryzae TaxID=1735285 RepID=UPI001583D34F|nr:PepSY-associated TM helix domain-containing protein [Vogesella oryzae]
MKRYLLLLHRYLGLGCACFLLLLGLSGSLLVFRADLETATGLRPAPAANVASYQALADAVLARYPGADFNLRFAAPGEAVQVRLHLAAGERRLWLDGGSARIAVDQADGHGLFDWLLRLHETLLLGEAGETLAGVCALLLMLLAISGVVYWWPRDWSRAWQLRRDKGLRVWLGDLHRLVGIGCCVLLLSAGLTGAYQVFNRPVNDWINGWYGYRAPAKIKLAPAPGAARLPLDELVGRAAQAMPGGRLVDIKYLSQPGKPLLLRWRLPGELHPNGRSNVEIDPYRGSLLRVTPVAQAAPAVRLTSWVYALHTGSLGGWPLRLLLLLAGVGLALLSASGVYQWAARRHKQRRARQLQLAARCQ